MHLNKLPLWEQKLNEKTDHKVDPTKFINWLMPQISDDEMYYILLDEVQKFGAFESVLNGFLRKSNMDVYVTGSNSKFLSRDIITEFEGRGDEVHILPLSFSEFYNFRGGDKNDACDEKGYVTMGVKEFLLDRDSLEA